MFFCLVLVCKMVFLSFNLVGRKCLFCFDIWLHFYYIWDTEVVRFTDFVAGFYWTSFFAVSFICSSREIQIYQLQTKWHRWQNKRSKSLWLNHFFLASVWHMFKNLVFIVIVTGKILPVASIVFARHDKDFFCSSHIFPESCFLPNAVKVIDVQ